MSDTVNDIRKKRKAALFKMAILLAFLAIIFAFASMHMQIKQMTAETA